MRRSHSTLIKENQRLKERQLDLDYNIKSYKRIFAEMNKIVKGIRVADRKTGVRHEVKTIECNEQV